ncbi:MAG: hypothetical protein JWM87_1546 [Candidatus Eremiobacteraeota bacterium]|nr:hypothetical protein [Candidatus Eremiobacteraeota bacterium]
MLGAPSGIVAAAAADPIAGPRKMCLTALAVAGLELIK